MTIAAACWTGVKLFPAQEKAEVCRPISIYCPAYDSARATIAPAWPLGIGEPPRLEGADQHTFDRLLGLGAQHWRLTGQAEADLFLYPHEYRPDEGTQTAASLAAEAGKPCLFFLGADDATPYHPSSGRLYRTSMFRSRQSSAERGMPAFSDDPYAAMEGPWPVHDKSPQPRVGFCGFVSSALRRTMYRLQARRQKVLGLALREQALRLLERSEAIETTFVRRRQFWAGALGRGFRDPQAVQRVRAEYWENVMNSDYTLCLRGAGNFSYRFYEVLSAGRIPIFIDTDCVLPLAEEVDWSQHCVWVPQARTGELADRVVKFHASLTNEEFRRRQVQNRELWLNRLRPFEFFQDVFEAEIGRTDSSR